MISDRDVWQAALLLLKRYGDDAMLEAVPACLIVARFPHLGETTDAGVD